MEFEISAGMWLVIAAAVVAAITLCAVAPAVLFVVNLGRYKPPRFGKTEGERVAVLIPARDEEKNIAACVESVLASREIDFEVLVLDDDSADRTVQVVLEIMARDNRVRLLGSGQLPRGWNGKQHACWQLAQVTTAPLLLFLDADVRLNEWALARSVASLRSKRVALLSGFPKQITVGFLEWLLLPLIHFVLLGFLPMGRMAKTTKPAYAAGCGQFLLVERDAYFASSGHAGIRGTRHDGLMLPKLLREHGFRTDLVDLTHLASVRMYETAGAVWLGLAKNATEGIGSPGRIVPFTLLLMLGQVLPTLLLLAVPVLLIVFWAPIREYGMTMGIDEALAALAMAVALALSLIASYVPRMLAAWRFKQPWKSAWLHPLGVVMLLTVQWYALMRQMIGKPVGWRARNYASGSGAEVKH